MPTTKRCVSFRVRHVTGCGRNTDHFGMCGRGQVVERVVTANVAGQDLKRPLQLAFGARKGEWVVTNVVG
jgi:hypothetical protein